MPTKVVYIKMPRYVSNLIHNAHAFKNLKCLFIDFCKTKEIVNLPNGLEVLFIRELTTCKSYDYNGNGEEEEDDDNHRWNYHRNANNGAQFGRDDVYVNNLPTSLKYLFIASTNIAKNNIRVPYGCVATIYEGVCGEFGGERPMNQRDGYGYFRYEKYQHKCWIWKKWQSQPKKLGYRNDEVLTIINCRQVLKDYMQQVERDLINSLIEDIGNERYEEMDDRIKFNKLYDALTTELQDEYDELSEEMNEEERMEYLKKWSDEYDIKIDLGREWWNNLSLEQQKEEIGSDFNYYIEENIHFIKLGKGKIINSPKNVDGECAITFFESQKHKRVDKNLLKEMPYEITSLYC